MTIAVALKHVATMHGRIGWQNLRRDEFTDTGPYLVTGMHFDQEGGIDWKQCFHISYERWLMAPEIQLRPSDVLVTKDGSIGKIAFIHALPGPAALNSHLLVIRPLREAFHPRFLYYVLNSQLFADFVAVEKRGTTFDGLTQESMERFPMPLPSVAKQEAIVSYLDREMARVDEIIAAKHRIVSLLKERRRALRDQAFSAEPGWRLKRLLAGSMAYGVLVPEFVETGAGVPMIRTYNLSAEGRVSHGDIAEIPADLAREYSRTSLREGDVILSVVGSMGRSAVVTSEEHGYNLNRPLARLQLQADIPPRLIWHWTQTTYFMDMAKLATSGGTAQPTLNLGDLANFMVGLPREKTLWPEILAQLEDGCDRLGKAEDAIDHQLGLLHERRQALITAAVTEQLDIPEAA